MFQQEKTKSVKGLLAKLVKAEFNMAVYHTRAGNPPGSVFEDYTCKQCGEGWTTNEGIKEMCPICRGEIDKFYQPIRR